MEKCTATKEQLDFGRYMNYCLRGFCHSCKYLKETKDETTTHHIHRH